MYITNEIGENSYYNDCQLNKYNKQMQTNRNKHQHIVYLRTTEYLLPKTCQILWWFFGILMKFCKRRNGTVGTVENKQNGKN